MELHAPLKGGIGMVPDPVVYRLYEKKAFSLFFYVFFCPVLLYTGPF